MQRSGSNGSRASVGTDASAVQRSVTTMSTAEPNPPVGPAYDRILLKLSGEALMGNDAYGINRETVERIVRQVKEVVDLGVQVAIVIGGGNIFRGVSQGAAGMDRANADYMGMLATVINAIALG